MQIVFRFHLHYIMKYFILVAILIASAFAAPSVLNKNVRITNGEDAERNQFPYQIAMYWGVPGIWSFICGGSVLSENWIVTAAHCITETPDIGGYQIRAGLLNLNDDLPEVQTVAVASYVLHEDYQGDVNPFDIAVLRLETSLTFTDAVQPIALPEADSIPTGEAIVSGWGSISTDFLPIMPNTLQTITVSLIDLDVCESAFNALFPGDDIPLDPTNICTGPLNSEISVCGGDSGGPLAQNGQLIGIVSWGVTPCGWPGAPSVYGRVSSFVDWIKTNTD